MVGSAAAALHDDSHAVQVAAEALAAVVPAWLHAGRAPADLVEALVATLPQTPAHRRLPLLSAVLWGLPEVRTAARSPQPTTLSSLLQTILRLDNSSEP